jgi:hypothetical protein
MQRMQNALFDVKPRSAALQLLAAISESFQDCGNALVCRGIHGMEQEHAL